MANATENGRKPQVCRNRAKSHHAHKVTRLLFTAGAVGDIGQDAVLLVIHIAHIEDEKRYTAPVAYRNEPLMRALGFAKWERLDRARRKAVERGWLQYVPPPRGVRDIAGRYWTTVPAEFEPLYGRDGTAHDERATDGLCPSEGYSEGQPSPSLSPADGYSEGELSSLSLSLSLPRRGARE